MAKKHGRERLALLVSEPHTKPTATALYEWVLVNYDDIESLRRKGDSWAPYVKAARADGVDLPDEKVALRRIERCWSRAVARTSRRMNHASPATDALPTEKPPARLSMPSREDRDWSPPMIDASDDTQKSSHKVAERDVIVGTEPDGKEPPSPEVQARLDKIMEKVRRAQIEQWGGPMEG
ncbi:hypothetical protein GOB87_15725 [Acetobacter estunensis]|uniref:Uncharacterized protein n=1 Tax=Acetobacter estunensis TaxID=104097 RepID=A0A967B920_9PROT|nr:hypothetical protein [Acetobacter estunensis]NHO55364.1 hypothetical protein [Acetobacter estunensis]